MAMYVQLYVLCLFDRGSISASDIAEHWQSIKLLMQLVVIESHVVWMYKVLNGNQKFSKQRKNGGKQG